MNSGESFAEDSVGGQKYITAFPHIFLKYPLVPRLASISASREVFEIQYSAETLERLQQVLPFPEIPIWEYMPDTRTNAIMTELQTAMSLAHVYGVADRVDILSFELLEMMLLKRKNTGPQDPYSQNIMKIASYFQLHYKEEIDWRDFLSRYGMSRSTFLRHWKRFFDLSPEKYRLKQRLEEACRLLREEQSMSVYEISEQLNFCEVNYFCAMFKQDTGMTPLQYRRKFISPFKYLKR